MTQHALRACGVPLFGCLGIGSRLLSDMRDVSSREGTCSSFAGLVAAVPVHTAKVSERSLASLGSEPFRPSGVTRFGFQFSLLSDLLTLPNVRRTGPFGIVAVLLISHIPCAGSTSQ